MSERHDACNMFRRSSLRAARADDERMMRIMQDCRVVSVNGVVCEVQPALGQHYAFIYDSWISSYERSREARALPRDWYHVGMRLRINALFDQSNTFAMLVEGVCVAWACIAPNAVHYAYVKRAYRRQGYATRLLEAMNAPKVYTHRVSGAWNGALERHGWRYAPEWKWGSNADLLQARENAEGREGPRHAPRNERTGRDR